MQSKHHRVPRHGKFDTKSQHHATSWKFKKVSKDEQDEERGHANSTAVVTGALCIHTCTLGALDCTPTKPTHSQVLRPRLSTFCWASCAARAACRGFPPTISASRLLPVYRVWHTLLNHRKWPSLPRHLPPVAPFLLAVRPALPHPLELSSWGARAT